MSNSRVFLLGFMGAGKTTLARKLAQQLNVPCLDLDGIIEEKEGMSIARIFEQRGEDHFRKVEQALLHETTTNNEHFVMALGGGTPCFHNNMEFIKAMGKSIYLKYNAGILASRLMQSPNKRPLIKGMDKETLLRYVEETLKLREPVYLQSNFTVDGTKTKPNQLVQLTQQA